MAEFRAMEMLLKAVNLAAAAEQNNTMSSPSPPPGSQDTDASPARLPLLSSDARYSPKRRMQLWADRPPPNKRRRVEVDKDGVDEGYEADNEAEVVKSYEANILGPCVKRGRRTMVWVMSN